MFFSVLVFCTGTDVGLGFDGSSYEYPTVDDQLPDGATGKVTRITIRQKPEGKICRRLLGSEIVQPNFIDQQFMLYRRCSDERWPTAGGLSTGIDRRMISSPGS